MKAIKEAEERCVERSEEICAVVKGIAEDVRLRGDEAVFEYSKKFDGSARKCFNVPIAEAENSVRLLSAEELGAMKTALKNIMAFARAQMSTIQPLEDFSPAPGLSLGHKIIPVDSAACYVPGGSYPLFSTALMLISPAKAAGVPRIAVCSPVMKNTDSINPKTLAAMFLAGADEIYAVGGVQAVAAFAYGTEQIKKTAMIVGPGNAYVAEAKRLCYGAAGIDFPAGPSEVLIIADESASSDVIAADLLAQCEHDLLAQGILVTTSRALAEETAQKIAEELKTLPTARIAAKSWERLGGIYLAESLEEAVEFANERAPEHLELQTSENEKLSGSLRNYGSLFIGAEAAEVFGDYVSGANHTLPTAGAARWTGGLWAGTFLKTLSFQKADKKAAAALAKTASLLAKSEGLYAHAIAAGKRLS